MGITPLELVQIEARLARNRRQPESGVSGSQSERETGKDGLQAQIQLWCDSQWPKWVYDFPRTDQRSTLPLGRHDSCIWGKFPNIWLIETKAKGKKRTTAQLIWAKRLEALGWTVHVCYSMEQFLEIVKEKV